MSVERKDIEMLHLRINMLQKHNDLVTEMIRTLRQIVIKEVERIDDEIKEIKESNK